MTALSDFYVYVYIDPRNFDEFYYGKGRGNRKEAHLHEDSDTEKVKQIKAIKKAGLEPIIRVIANNLSEHDALLVEKTLLWKLGKHLTNKSSGHYSKNFRPKDQLHKKLSGFDYQNDFYYYNVGEGKTKDRSWNDYVDYGFIAAGGGARWRDAICAFEPGDFVAAYIKGMGYVGIGKITHHALPVYDVKIKNKALLELPLKSRLDNNMQDPDRCEYAAIVKWIVTVERSQGYWKRNAGLYAPQKVRASLKNQDKTVSYLEHNFRVQIDDLLSEDDQK